MITLMAIIILTLFILTFDHLLMVENVDLVQSKCVPKHHDAREQKENVKQTSQKREVVDVCKEYPLRCL